MIGIPFIPEALHRRIVPAVLLALLALGPVSATAQTVDTSARLTASPSSALLGSSIALHGTVFAPGLSAPTGQLIFRDGEADIGSVALTGGTSVAFNRVHSGQSTTCAVATTGPIYCWGDNSNGAFGNRTTVGSSVPVPTVGITNAVAVSTSGFHTCAVLATGAVQCWGANNRGQLGDGSTTQRLEPVSVTGITSAVAVTAGAAGSSCALLASGAVQCWGSNDSGQLGNGETQQSPVPVSVSGISSAVSISAGAWFTCAVLGSGEVRCWGRGEWGKLGNGATEDAPTPVTVSGITNAVSVTAGFDHACAVLVSGEMRCWGGLYDFELEGYGLLGNGSTEGSTTPVPVTGITTAVSAAGGLQHTCAVLASGAVQCWGSSFSLGDAVGTARSTVPITVASITTAQAVAAGSSFNCALMVSGTSHCWGAGAFGRMGNNSGENQQVPVGVSQSRSTGSMTTSALPLGRRTLTAHYPGAAGFGASTSAPWTVTINPLLIGFQGGGAVFMQNAGCAEALGTTPHPVTVRYWPSELNDRPTGVTVVWPEGSEHLAVWGPTAASDDFRIAVGRSTWSRFIYYPVRPMIRVVQRDITEPAGATELFEAQEVLLRLRVQAFSAIPRCAVTIAAILRRE